jgi:hypothetical protein
MITALLQQLQRQRHGYLLARERLRLSEVGFAKSGLCAY